jgi:hypothetical protein
LFVLAGAEHEVADGFAGVFALLRMSSICSVMGISMLCRRARPRAARVVRTPSATLPPRLSRTSGSLRPWPNAFSDGAVAAERAGAGEDEVADTGEAGEGFALAAAGDGEAGDFGDAAGDEGGGGVVAEADAGSDAGGDGDDVLEGSAELDADDVGGGVEAEGFGRELLLNAGGDIGSAKAITMAVGWPCATSMAKLGPLKAPMGSAEREPSELNTPVDWTGLT